MSVIAMVMVRVFMVVSSVMKVISVVNGLWQAADPSGQWSADGSKTHIGLTSGRAMTVLL